jgi:hypothetical protein
MDLWASAFKSEKQPVSDAWSQFFKRMVPVRTVVISPGEIQGRPVALAALFTLNAAFELTDAGTVFQAKRVRAAITAQSTDVAPNQSRSMARFSRGICAAWAANDDDHQIIGLRAALDFVSDYRKHHSILTRILCDA